MLSATTFTSILGLISTLQSPVSALLPITTKGNRFIRPSVNKGDEGTVFFINGVDYQPGGSSAYTYDMTSDVLTNPEVCARDATLIQNLGANTIRVYTIDPDLNHDECMSIFNSAGIYVVLDVNSPLGGESLNRDDPSGSYDPYYMSRVFKVIESFRSYSNVIGFFMGNEVINNANSAEIDPAYLRAITRDAKQYINARNANETDPRELFVGYSAADVVNLRMPTYEYLTCSLGNDISNIDFFGLNSYEWCSGVNDWQSSGYEDIKTSFANASVPIFFSEYGCNTKSPRTFDEVSEGIYDGLINTLNGGLVYEYSEEAANYGLVDIESEDSVTLLADYFNFKSQLEKSNIPTIAESNVQNYTASSCNATLIKSLDSSFNASFSLPTANSDIKSMINDGVSVEYPGQFVNVDKYLNMYISGASMASNLTRADFVVSTGSATTTTSIYLTINSTNLINNLSTSTSLTSSSVQSTTSSISSTSSVSSVKSTSHKNDGSKQTGCGLVAAVFGVIMALI